MKTTQVGDVIVTRMRWWVGQLCMLTWKISVHAADVAKLLGLLFHGADRDRMMQVIF